MGNNKGKIIRNTNGLEQDSLHISITNSGSIKFSVSACKLFNLINKRFPKNEGFRFVKLYVNNDELSFVFSHEKDENSRTLTPGTSTCFIAKSVLQFHKLLPKTTTWYPIVSEFITKEKTSGKSILKLVPKKPKSRIFNEDDYKDLDDAEKNNLADESNPKPHSLEPAKQFTTIPILIPEPIKIPIPVFIPEPINPKQDIPFIIRNPDNGHPLDIMYSKGLLSEQSKYVYEKFQENNGLQMLRYIFDSGRFYFKREYLSVLNLDCLAEQYK